jgi:hypothetical protein
MNLPSYAETHVFAQKSFTVQARSKQKKETPGKTWSLFFVQLNECLP